MQILVNGKDRKVPDGTSVFDLLGQLDLQPGTVVVEWNGQVLPRDGYDQAVLAEGDRLEIVRFVGGG
jgi:thiamine biosynthesis protein ThiS